MLPPLSERLRQALRDFKSLASGRARLETDAEQEFRERSQVIEKEWSENENRIQQAHRDAVAQTEEQATQARNRIEDQFMADRLRAKDDFAAAKKKATQTYAATKEATIADFKESRWTITTLYEAGKKVARDQFQDAQHRLKVGLEKLQRERQEALERLQEWQFANALPFFPNPSQVAAAPDPWQAFERCGEQGTNALERLSRLKLPRYTKGSFPYVVIVFAWIVASLPALLITEWYWWLLATTLTVFPFGLLILWWLGVRARTIAVYLWSVINQSLVDAQELRGRCVDLAKATYRQQKAENKLRNQQSLNEAGLQARNKMQSSRQQRNRAIKKAQAEFEPLVRKINERHERDLRTLEKKLRDRLAELLEGRDSELQSLAERCKRMRDETNRKHADAWTRLVGAWKQGCAKFLAEARSVERDWRRWFPPWNEPSWKTWRPPAEMPLGLTLGRLHLVANDIPHAVPQKPHLQQLDLDGVVFPALIPFPEKASILFLAQDEGKAAAVRALQNLLLRCWTALPAGKLRCTIIDPVGRGENFSAFMHLADHDESLVNSRIWTEQAHIEQRLADLTAHMENVLQKYLRNQYQTLAEYNAQAGEVAEPFRVLVVADFPVNFSPDAARRLISLASSGARCGIYTFVMVDTKQPLPQGIDLDDLDRVSNTLSWKRDRFVWEDPDFGVFPMDLEGPPAAEESTQILRIAGEEAKRASRVEVPFELIMPPREEWWRSDSSSGISVPLGRAGATGRQNLTLGHGTAQHALIAGKTGSGKSTLLHVLILQLAMRYSPDEVELYLIDFKKGVEFKTYASHGLPHARVVAVESEREFGLSVLQRLDAELVRRGEMFRQAGVNDLPSYRQSSTGANGQTSGSDAKANAALPRIVLIVDEFQEFFVEDDKIAQESALLLDRLVRQGRAFGVHILLGSQTLGGAYSLARSTIDQMAIRIALQCSEADAHLILSKDNSEARLLSRPGEAIYNAAGGLLEGNNFFQIVWLNDDRRDLCLEQVRQLGEDWRSQGRMGVRPQIVFEGSSPSNLESNPQLEHLLKRPTYRGPTVPIYAWLGDSVSIKDPTAAVFRRQSGCNVAIIGQQDETAFGIVVAGLVALSVQLPLDSPAPSLNLVVAAALEGESNEVFQAIPTSLPVRIVQQRDLPATLTTLTEELDRRLKGETDRPPQFLFLHGLQRLRDLRRPDDDFGFGKKGEPPSPFKMFLNLLREGPTVGIHTVLWCDTLANVQRSFDRQALREFEMRVLFQMSPNDSSTLMDMPTAAKLGPHRALFYTEDQGKVEKFRPFGLPDVEWLRGLKLGPAKE